MNTIETNLKKSSFEFFRRLFIIFTSSSLFIAISGSFKTYFSFSLYSTPHIGLQLLATFLVIYAVYGLNKTTDIKEDQINNPNRTDIILRNKKVIKQSATLSYLLAVIIGCYYGWKVLIIFLFPLILGVMYSIQIHPSIPRLKDIFPLKSLIVALSWSVGNTFLPIVNGQINFLLILFIFYFFFTKSFINTVLFDLLDLEGDEKIGTPTLPVVMGPSRTLMLLIFLNSSICIMFLISLSCGFFQSFTLPLIFCLIYCYFYILYFYKVRSRLGMEIMVDGEWIPIVFISLLTTP